MKIIKTKFKNLFILRTNIFKDNRGYFKEVHQKKILNKNFVFDCFSFSKKNTLRGLHFQKKNSQAKLLTVVRGKILDVVVDLRKNSKTFGKYFKIIISDKSNFSIYIPEGFAHGFLCLSKKCAVYYKCSKYRNARNEKILLWNDKKLNISWNIKKPILSKKDKKGTPFHQILD